MKKGSIIRKPFRYVYRNAALILIAINCIMYFLTDQMPVLKSMLSLNVIYVAVYHAYWQFFSYMFIHESLSHLLMNMISLFFFGVAVERAIGSREFLLLYMLAGIVSGFVSFISFYISGIAGNQYAFYIRLLGASGAIYAILLSYAVIFPRSNIYVFGILPIPAPLLVGIWTIMEIGSQLLNSQSGIAHLTHLAGLAFAWLYFLVRMGVNPWKVWKQQYR